MKIISYEEWFYIVLNGSKAINHKGNYKFYNAIILIFKKSVWNWRIYEIYKYEKLSHSGSFSFLNTTTKEEWQENS